MSVKVILFDLDHRFRLYGQNQKLNHAVTAPNLFPTPHPPKDVIFIVVEKHCSSHNLFCFLIIFSYRTTKIHFS